MELADWKKVELFFSQHSLSDEIKCKIPPSDTRPGLEEAGHRYTLEEAGIEDRLTLEEAGIEIKHTLEEAGIEHRYTLYNVNNNYAYI